MSSSWGNGHATIWRGLLRVLGEKGHQILFFEKDVPYYAKHRDPIQFTGVKLYIYQNWKEAYSLAKMESDQMDVGIVTSFCPDAIKATEFLISSSIPLKLFYDLDTPVTLNSINTQGNIDYLGPHLLKDFDAVFSFTGGNALEDLKVKLGAKKAFPLYGCADSFSYKKVSSQPKFISDLSYMGTYSKDRQTTLEKLFIEPAKKLKEKKFKLAGSLYPTALAQFCFPSNLNYIPHLPPLEHPAFYSSSQLTLNITRRVMAKMGYCPSGRLFEAALCKTAIISDYWEGLDEFFTPGQGILIAQNSDDIVQILSLSPEELNKIAKNSFENVMECHTAEIRAQQWIEQLESLIERPTVICPTRNILGIIPAAGKGSRIQPLAFSKELLPVGSILSDGSERPRAISEYLIERMIQGGASQICFVISPGKSDILEYFGGSHPQIEFCYVVQPTPLGLCDSIFKAIPLIQGFDQVLIGLPDTLWFPVNAFEQVKYDPFSLILFSVAQPELFDSVELDVEGWVQKIHVKQKTSSSWVWGGICLSGSCFRELYQLWCLRANGGERDEYLGSLMNGYLEKGGKIKGKCIGEKYVDVGTLHGYREAIQLLK